MTPPSPSPSRTPRLRMTLDEYGVAIRAAYEEGYVQGAYHRKPERILVKCRELSGLFWARVEHALTARRAAARRTPEAP